MNLGRFAALLLALPLLSGLLGCDVAVIAVLASKSGSSSSNKSSVPPPPDLSFAVYVGSFANPAAASAEAVNLETNGGIPTTPPWSFVGRATATTIWAGITGGNNTVLIQGPLNQVYDIDTIERLNANGAVIEVPLSSNVFANSAVTTPLSNASGMLDGVSVTTKITDPTHNPCLVAFFTQPIINLRVRIWGTDRSSGDCVWTNSHSLSNADTFVVGGAAASPSGTIYASYSDTTLGQSFVLPFSAAGTKQSALLLSLSSSTTGGISPAVDIGENLYVAAELAAGSVQIQKFALGAAPAQWTYPYTGVAAAGANFIGPHALTIANNVPLISAATNGTAVFMAAGQGTSGSHTVVRIDDTPNNPGPPPFTAAQVWGPLTVADPASKQTSWSAVATSGIADVLTTGNLNNNTSGNIELFTQDRSMATGALVWPTPVVTTGGATTGSNGNAIAVDSQGFAYVAGRFGSVANGKDSILLRYNVADGAGLTMLYQNGVSSGSLSFSGSNEFLGAAIDSDGSIYVVGYVTHTDLVSTTAVGAVTSMWIGKFPPASGVPVWTATFNAGTGNDQAISVSLSGAFVYVVGQNAVPGPKNGLRVFKFVK